MHKDLCYVIKVKDQAGNWYDNAYIENGYDAIQVARFYRDQLGYFIQIWTGDKDVTSMLDQAKFLRVKYD